MKYRMSEGMTNIGTPLKEAMERTPRPNTPLGLPLFWDAPAPRPDGSLINEGTKEPEQEPVGRLESDPDEGHVFVPRIDGDWSMLGEDLYTSPPQRTWVGLTDEQIAKEVEAELTHYWNGEYIDTTGARDQLKAFARAIEAKLKEKNT